jgi:hypothetical protein
MTSRMRIWTVGAVAAAVLAAPGTASAAFDVTAFALTPSTTAAGAHADVTIATSFTPYNMADPPPQPRNVVFHLPPGVAGDPFATPRCGEAAYRADACPAAAKIGTVEARATPVPALGLPLPTQTSTGDLYNLVPAGTEPARLGAVIRPLAGLTGKLFVPTTIRARATDGGLDSIVTDLPTELGGIRLYTERMAFTLHGRPGGGSRPFMRNPTACKPATTTVEATSYGDPPARASKTSTFTPTACGALPFAPHIAGSTGANGATARQAKPPVQTVITQGAEQANQTAATVVLPPALGVDFAQLNRACQPAQLAARACPASARVGTVRATTPLLAAPLTGSVYLSQAAVGALPGLTIQLADPIPLRLDGTAELTPQGLKTTFTGLPDVPLSRFQLDLPGGPSGLFQASEDLCAAEPPQVTAAFAAHSGARASETKTMTVAGCTPPPQIKARIAHLRTRRPTLRLRVTAATDGPDLRELRLLLPNALKAKPKRARRGALARAGGKRLRRSAIRLTRDGELRIAPPAGTRKLSAKLSKGALRVSRRLARKRKPKRLALRVLVRDADGLRPAVTLRVRPRRR